MFRCKPELVMTWLVSGILALSAARDARASFDGEFFALAPQAKEKPRDGVKPPAGDKKKPGEEMIVVTGKVVKDEKKGAKDDGTPIVVTRYYLIEPDGNKVLLPSPRVNEAGKLIDKIHVPDFVNKEVVLTGRGLVVAAREGANAPRRVSKILSIITITENKKK
jgi:hypothetical protein